MEMNKICRIQNLSSKLLKFFVRDLLDFQSIRQNKINKDVSKFDIREAIAEIVDVLSFQAKKN